MLVIKHGDKAHQVIDLSIMETNGKYAIVVNNKDIIKQDESYTNIRIEYVRLCVLMARNEMHIEEMEEAENEQRE